MRAARTPAVWAEALARARPTRALDGPPAVGATRARRAAPKRPARLPIAAVVALGSTEADRPSGPRPTRGPCKQALPAAELPAAVPLAATAAAVERIAAVAALESSSSAVHRLVARTAKGPALKQAQPPLRHASRSGGSTGSVSGGSARAHSATLGTRSAAATELRVGPSCPRGLAPRSRQENRGRMPGQRAAHTPRARPAREEIVRNRSVRRGSRVARRAHSAAPRAATAVADLGKWS
jgi:hypothetical protein